MIWYLCQNILMIIQVVLSILYYIGTRPTSLERIDAMSVVSHSYLIIVAHRSNASCSNFNQKQGNCGI